MNVYVHINIHAKPIFFVYSAVLSIFSWCLRPICHLILLETSFCDTRVFWTNLVCSESCWVSIRKQMQITASWLEPFTLKPQRIFALTFWFSIKDGLGIFKQLINWSSWKKGHLQSHSSWCVVSVSIGNSGKEPLTALGLGKLE